MIRKLFYTSAILLSLCACSQEAPVPEPKPDDKSAPQADFQAKVIYGRDNRMDLYQLGNSPWRRVAGATVALMKNSKLAYRSGGEMEVKTTNFGLDYNLCSDEPFRDQGTAAFCSGFFVGGDVVMTAGHCIRSESDCGNTSIVFGFALNAAGQYPDRVPSAQVYRCRKIIKSLVSSTDGVDYAVIHLDRAVEGVTPVKLRTSGTAQVGQELVVIGHPAGLPTKVAAEGTVRAIQGGFLVAGLDTYGGNSGSAVFNGETGDVEGILVRGETDFRWRGQCRASNVCEQDDCRGEDVTRIEFPRAAYLESQR